MRRICLAGLLGLPASGPVAGDGAVPGWNKLAYLMYRIEVAAYCGLAGDEATAGFRRQRDALLAEYPLAPSLIDSARAESGTLAHREWDNRGLGGFRRRCREDAARYAEQFIRARNRSD